MARRKRRETVLVVGLGRFGSAVALELEALDHEVLVIDPSERLVQQYASQVTHAVQGDATDPATLLSLGVDELRHAVVAIGDDMEASILATAAIADLGVENVWAKAATAAHASILERVGADHVVFAERDMGQRVAHRVTGQIIDFIQIDEDFALAETGPPRSETGKTLNEAQLRQRYGITVVSIKPAGGNFTYATPETVLDEDAVLLVAGTNAAVERFAATT